ncbi:hypothetical protein EUGRSUZ_E02750 [Eucalyptus grandis]|uniref:Uncharacterized protein n=2 Tax=Eucalyptus grandis TaxID=71139 RepID=A0ACC3KXS4_EUCGR|nr:hypothetical protein EUGRSUZ_E02750 [Eucalyptus grandis]
MLPDINKLIPTCTSQKPFDKHAHVDADREFRVVIVPPHERILHHVIPQAHRHVVGARRQQAPPVRRELDLPHGVPVAVEHGDGDAVAPHVPNPNALVDGGGGDHAVVVLVPVEGEDLGLVGGEDHGGAGLPDVPDAGGAVAGGGGEDVGVAGVPGGGVDAVGVLLEGADAGGAVDGPELDGVVPGGGEEGVAAGGVVVDALDLAGVLVEGAERVAGGREGGVVELDGAVGDGGDEEGVVRFRPGDVVDAVGGVEGGDLGDGGARGGRQGEDVEAAVAEDAEVLGGRRREAVLVEGAELDGIFSGKGCFETSDELYPFSSGYL